MMMMMMIIIIIIIIIKPAGVSAVCRVSDQLVAETPS
jgi:hypothetical protein